MSGEFSKITNGMIQGGRMEKLKAQIREIFKEHVTWHDIITIEQFEKWIKETEKQVLALLDGYTIIKTKQLQKLLFEFPTCQTGSKFYKWFVKAKKLLGLKEQLQK